MRSYPYSYQLTTALGLRAYVTIHTIGARSPPQPPFAIAGRVHVSNRLVFETYVLPPGTHYTVMKRCNDFAESYRNYNERPSKWKI